MKKGALRYWQWTAYSLQRRLCAEQQRQMRGQLRQAERLRRDEIPASLGALYPIGQAAPETANVGPTSRH